MDIKKYIKYFCCNEGVPESKYYDKSIVLKFKRTLLDQAFKQQKNTKKNIFKEGKSTKNHRNVG